MVSKCAVACDLFIFRGVFSFHSKHILLLVTSHLQLLILVK